MLKIFATAILAIGALCVASPAHADEVWFQSVGRASATAPCPDASFGTPWQSGWDPAEQAWRPSWGQWMNGGAGGFTCDRSITWAKNSPYPSGGCVLYDDDSVQVYYVNFGGGWWLGDTIRYNDPACTSVYSVDVGTTYPADIVYAPAPWDGAALCREAFGSRSEFPVPAGTNGVWSCVAAFA